MKMKTLEDIRAELLQSMQKAHSNTANASKIDATSNPAELHKAAQDTLTAAIAGYLAQNTATTATTPSTTTAPRGKKGIALCHESQGYSANLRPDSLLMKAGRPGISLQVNKAALQDADPELLAALKRLGYVLPV
ncbi:hypothetical protein [Winslowiella iniecta]|uniref:Uncharacterized protein n=1 Tax=Winslowiella iniecta TaxID=1560201 RepID=A0A0L7T9Y6_9GAMM|nr:hypothetical protein [Winslowiella iniecta]KOC88839.1 hypothetical protein NG43_19505 [Winslowiella iniecta]KOC92178.1 hypothetical protein NG42_02955 [Winslowiella iniecta]